MSTPGQSLHSISVLVPHSDIYKKKRRRESSKHKMFIGDYLSVFNLDEPKNPLKPLLAQYDDYDVLFSDTVCKLNRKGALQSRILIITALALYNIEAQSPTSWKTKRRIPLTDIEAICVSPYDDNFFVVRTTDFKPDYIYACSRKTELIIRLCYAHEYRKEGDPRLVWLKGMAGGVDRSPAGKRSSRRIFRQTEKQMTQPIPIEELPEIPFVSSDHKQRLLVFTEVQRGVVANVYRGK
eukprot:gnl/Dysnectes_brevis/2402_a2850_1471.p1 GENE.gnl/Dysnectes_brevis/2402_a2850_1471~~gnl/Dysnectes_brevis/2402_a2850_1471.p1  ORF type:complete len:248 (-),score=28.65 gnl/Dysnectes_brevis/2402_a2850_1471:22-735(-)